MADNVITNLSIEVTASADKAASMFDRLASSAGHVRGAARGAAGGMQNAAQSARDMGIATQEAGIQTGNATISVGRFWNALRGVGSKISSGFVRAVHRGTAAIGVFLKSIARIAFYRAIRSIIKDFGQSFKDLYGYSRLFGTDFAKSMDRITTASVYLRNSFVAMVAPLVNMFAPALDMIADKIVDIMNFVNQLFAAINGQTTYTVAKKVATTWENTFDSAANHANKRIKEVRNTLLGFDEINRLNGETPTTSGSTGSSPYTPGYSTMFEEKPLEGFFEKISNVTSGWPDWLKWLFGIGTVAIGAWGISKLPGLIGKIFDALKNLFAITIPSWFRRLFGGDGDDGDGGFDIPKEIDLPDADLTVDLKQGDWSVLDNIKGKDFPVNIVPSQSANSIWTTLVDAWNKITRSLIVTIATNVTADKLFELLQSAWNNLQNKKLYFDVKMNQTAKGLWNGLKTAWEALGTKKLYFNVAMNQNAKGLWNGLKTAWEALGTKKLYFNVVMNQTAKGLWNGLKTAWEALGTKKLYFNVVMNQNAKGLWNGLKTAWEALGTKKLYFNVAMNQNAKGLWNGLKTAWEALGLKTLYVYIAFQKTGWTTVTKYVDDSFGGATGGGGGTKGGGAGRNYTVGIGLQEDKSTTTSSNLWSMWWGIFKKTLKAEQDIALKLTGGDGLEKSGSGYKVKGVASEVSVKVNAKAGDGFVTSRYQTGANSFTLNPIQDSVVTVNAQPGAGLSRKDAYSLKLNEVETSTINQPVALEKYGWSWVNTWVEKFAQTSVLQYIGLAKLWWDTVSGWVSGSKGNTIDQLVGLMKYGWTWVDEWAKQYAQTPIQQKVDLVLGKDYVTGGGTGKGVVSNMTKANGGIFANGMWSNIPQYANGTTNAHGSLFLAGEAGPEIVGHVGGRTEVLNKSQLASAMYSAVQAAMAPAAANFAAAAQSMGSTASIDFETLADMVQQGVERAMGRQNELDRQRNEYLRQINEKEFSADISTSSINKAQQRMNRRAGTTIVAVG